MANKKSSTAKRQFRRSGGKTSKSPSKSSLSFHAQTKSPTLHRLNVVFHGLFVIDYQQNGVKVMAPTVPNHQYLVGTWKQEDPMVSNKPYRLEGLKPRKTMPKLDPTSIPILKNPPPKLAMNLMKVSLSFPFPDSVYGIRCVSRKTDNAGNPIPFYNQSGKYAPSAALQYFPVVTVFVYNYDPSSESPYLAGSTWKAPKNLPRPLNLHVRAEMQYMDMTVNTQAILRAALGIEQPIDLQLEANYDQEVPSPDSLALSYGVAPDEECELIELFPATGSADPLFKRNGFGVGKLAPVNCSQAHTKS
jgi:hypothetical protein